MEDQRSDVSRRVLVAIARRLADPAVAEELLKTAAAMRPEREAAVYAWPERNTFPLDSAEDVLLSRAYFEAQREGLEQQTAARIEERLAAHEILRGRSPNMAFKERKKTAAEAALELLPGIHVAGAEELRQAGEDFKTHHLRLDYDERRAFARNYVKRAQTLLVDDLPQEVRIYAGLSRVRPPEALRKHLELRKAAALRRGKDGTAYEKLAQSLEETQPELVSPEEWGALAATIHTLDMEHGVTDGRNARRLPDACRVVFTGENPVDPACETAAPPEAAPDKQELVRRFGEGVLEDVERPDGGLDVRRIAEIMRLFGQTPDMEGVTHARP